MDLKIDGTSPNTLVLHEYTFGYCVSSSLDKSIYCKIKASLLIDETSRLCKGGLKLMTESN